MARRRPTYANLGEVSSGTLRDEDLISSFSWELRYYLGKLRLTREQRARFIALCKDCDEPDKATRPVEDLVEALFDALEEIAPPYATFGASDGDGASFGFWPSIDDDELPRLTAGDEIPREHWGEDVLMVNDHGNADCGYVSKRGQFRAYWSVV